MAQHLSVSDVSRSHVYGQNHTDRTAVMFRKDEFRTPSPLLPFWHHHAHTFDNAAMDEESNDDFYFHSSENIGCNLQLPDVKCTKYGPDVGSLNGSQVFPLEPLDNCHLRCKTPEFPDICGFGSRNIATDRTPVEGSCTRSQLSKSQRLIIDRRNTGRWTLQCVQTCILLLLLCYVTSVNVFRL